VSQYRYAGATDQEHVLQTTPLTVAPMAQLLPIDEQHPSDIEFLPDVNDLDAGYLFVTEEYVNRRVTVYRWAPFQDLVVQGRIFQGFPAGGPNFVFVDRVGDYYYLGIASDHWGWGSCFARATPRCSPGARRDRWTSRPSSRRACSRSRCWEGWAPARPS
jgi:hypothetical protein